MPLIRARKIDPDDAITAAPRSWPVPDEVMVVVLFFAALLAASVPASAQAADGPCPEGSGVTVVIDFQDLDRDTIIRCADQPAETGLEALQQVGLSIEQVGAFPGVICRVEGLPADTACSTMPAADYYWSYWHAEPGGQWTYADDGATGRRPTPGSVDAWSFVTDGAASRTTEPRTEPPRPAAPQDTSPPPDTDGPDADAPELPAPGSADAPQPPALGEQPPAAEADGAGDAAAPRPAPAPVPEPEDDQDDDSDDVDSNDPDSDDADSDDADSDGGASGNAAPGDDDDPEPNADDAEGEPSPRPSAFDAAPPRDAPDPLPSDQVAVLDERDSEETSRRTPVDVAVAGGAAGVALSREVAGGPPVDTLAGVSLILIMSTVGGLAAYRRRQETP